MTDAWPDQWTLELPAALLHVWPRGDREGWQRRIGRLCDALGPGSGVYRLDTGLLAVVPVPGDPAVLDTAASYGRLLAAGARRPLSGGAGDAGLLVTPGVVRVAGDGAEAVPGPLLEDLERKPATLPPGEVHITGRAARTLETRREVVAAGPYDGPTGRSVPLYLVGRARDPKRPWRNPELLGRQLKAVARPELAEALHRAVAGAPAVTVRGGLGCGKTRLVIDTLAGSEPGFQRATTTPRRSAEPSLAEQIAAAWLPLAGNRAGDFEGLMAAAAEGRRRQLLGESADDGAAATGELIAELPALLRSAARSTGRPLVLLLDDLERAEAQDLALVSLLLADAEAENLRLVLAGRRGATWPAAWDDLPRIDVPRFERGDQERCADQILSGLSLPSAVRERLLQASAGNPFALEEGVAALIHRRAVRRIYGNFFFSGGDDTGFVPSARLVQHVEAETGRLGSAAPLRLLAAAAVPLPAAELRSAAALAPGGGQAEPGWEERFVDSGWLERRASPWGEGVGFAIPAWASALVATLGPETAARARHASGELVAELARDPAARWAAYRLVAGSPEAVPLLLDLATRDPRAGGPALPASDEDLLAALTRELVEHRERGDDAETELALLLAILPLALRTAHLEGLADEIKKAMHLALEHGGGGPERLLALARLKADLDRREGRLAKAEQTLRKALKTSRLVDETGKAALLVQLGRVLIEQQRLDEAAKLFRQVLERVDHAGQEALTASCRFYLGNIALHRAAYRDAFDHHRRALELRRELPGALKPTIASLTALGAVCLALGRYSEALQYYEQAEEGARAAGDDEELAFVLLGVGRALSRLGDLAAAASPLRQALALREGSGDEVGEGVARLAVADNLLALDRPREALAEAREAHFRLSLHASGAPGAEAEQLLGRIQLSRRQPQEARGYLQRALAYHRDRGDRVAAAFDRAFLLDAALAEDSQDEVMTLTRQLGGFLAGDSYPEQGERLDYRMFRGLEFLRELGIETEDPEPFLRRAYQALLAKAGLLDPPLRQVFLYQIPDNEAIVLAATKAGLTG